MWCLCVTLCVCCGVSANGFCFSVSLCCVYVLFSVCVCVCLFVCVCDILCFFCECMYSCGVWLRLCILCVRVVFV